MSKRSRFAPGCLLLCLVLPRTAAAAPDQRFVIDVARSRLVGHLLKAGLASGLAHDHVIRARRFSGELTLRGLELSSARLDLRVETHSFEADAPPLRRSYGMKSMLSTKERAKVLHNLCAADQLDCGRYPSIRFVSSSLRPALKGKWYLLAGSLTIRGQTRPATLKVALWQEGRRIKGQGQLSLLQSSFGYQPYSAGLGLVKVRDRMTIDIYLEAERGPPASAPPAGVPPASVPLKGASKRGPAS